ncbi:MAG: hydroxyacid dehydrogenase [Clostridiales bacterium]|nr:hydroxyacid dehydrogenase [Clostridiales bacterium]
MKTRVFVSVPEGAVRRTLFSPELIGEMERRYDVRWNALDRQLDEDELSEALADAEVLLTGWGSVKITGRVLDAAPKLRMIGHTGGTISDLVDESFFARGVRIVSANATMAMAVAEYCLMMALMARWDIMGEMGKMRENRWHALGEVMPGLMGSTVGIVDYGDIARCFIQLLKPMEVKIRVSAPYLTQEFAAENGFELVTLDEAMGCDVVSIHSTLTPASFHSIDAKRLAQMRDGAVLINSARGAVIDEEALVAELKTGRIRAVLDVFETEPLPADHVLRNRLPNVLNTPHVAAASQYWRCRQVRSVVEDIDRVLAGEKTRNEITLERYRMLSPSYK